MRMVYVFLSMSLTAKFELERVQSPMSELKHPHPVLYSAKLRNQRTEFTLPCLADFPSLECLLALSQFFSCGDLWFGYGMVQLKDCRSSIIYAIHLQEVIILHRMITGRYVPVVFLPT